MQLKEFEIQNKQTCRSDPAEWTDPASPTTNESFSCNVSLCVQSEGIFVAFLMLNHNFRQCVVHEGLWSTSAKAAELLTAPLSFPLSLSHR